MSFLAKTYQFLNRFVPTIENKTDGTYKYGVNDLLPNDNLRIINDSGVAKRCIRKKARYIQGDGFSNKDSGIFKINPTQTADELLQQISSYAAYNEGFALQVRRTVDAKIAEIKAIPFQCVRRKLDGNFTYNPKLSQRDFKKAETTIHPAFNPALTPELLTQQLKTYAGQPEIFYVFEETADNPYYPVPDYNAGIEDIQTAAEIQKVDLECVENGFITSGILTTHEINNTVKDDHGKTDYNYFCEEIESFTGRKKDDQGKSGRYKLLHLMVSNMAEAPKLEGFDPKPILEASNSKRDIIGREVCRHIGVHPVLAGFSDAAILGNQLALSNAIAELNNYINPTQRMIQRAFKAIYPLNDWTISQFNPVTYIPDQVWDVMTEDEKRAVIGLQPKAVPATTTSITTPAPATNGTHN